MVQRPTGGRRRRTLIAHRSQITLPGDLFEGGKLSKEVPLWLSRASKHFGAWAGALVWWADPDVLAYAE